MRNIFFMVSVLAICGMSGAEALAAPDEIQVYTEEINNPGEFGLEQHLNYTIKGEKTESYPGQMVSHHVTQVTPEFSYGITKTLEAGLYVPVAITPDGDVFLNGLRLRLKYIAPRQDNDPFFYGLNVELGRDSRRTSESISGMEFRPIVGYRNADWLVSFNPILNVGLTADVSHQPQFEPALKLAHSVGAGTYAGIEYYGEFGSLSHVLPGSQRAHTVYAVLDVETHGFDVNFGIGRGFVNAGDDWVMKGIIALPFK